MIKNVYRFHVQYPSFLSDFNKTLTYLTDFRTIHKYQISYISVQWSRVLTRGRTWRSFSLFAILRTRLKALYTKCVGLFIIQNRFKRQVVTYSGGLDQTLFSTHRLAAVLLVIINLGCTNFPKLYEPPEYSIRQKVSIKFRMQNPRKITRHSIKFSLRVTLLLGFVHPCNNRYIVTLMSNGHTVS
jgi:hypothetical protein